MKFIFKAFLTVSSGLPLRMTHGIGSLLGLLLMYWPNRLKNTARINLRLCYPRLSEAERRQLCRRCLQESGKTLLEIGAMWRLPRETLLGKITATHGETAFRQAIAENKGVVVIAPHLGCWELVGLYVSTLGPMTSLYRPPKYSELDDTYRRSRQRFGARLVPTHVHGIRQLYRALAAGEIIGILPDQDAGRHGGLAVPFFGVPAYTMTLLPRLLQKSAATAFFVWAERLAAGRGYRLHFIPAHQALYDPDLKTAVTALNTQLQECINRAPAQYQWTYKRFKTRPPGMPPLYP